MSVRQKTVQALALASVVAMVLFLAGCGGGSGGDGGPPDEMPVTPEQPTPVPVNNAFTRNDEMLGLFEQANGMDIMMAMDDDDPTTMEIDETNLDELRMDEAMQFIAQLDEAAKIGQGRPTRDAAGDTRDHTDPGIIVLWAAEDDTDNTGMVDESELRIEIDPDVPNQFDADELETDQITSNYRTINGLGDFMHGFEIWREEDDPEDDPLADQARAIVFTDKQQGVAAVQAVTAVVGYALGGEPVTTDNVVMFDPANAPPPDSGQPITGVTYFESQADADTGDLGLAYTGRLICPDDGSSCSYTVSSSGSVGDIDGYIFIGHRPDREAVAPVAPVENDDYLVFGLWLYENADDGAESFGAFADGGREYPTGRILMELDGQATYTGKAFGAHHMDGMISWFDADASITLDWDVSISGSWARAMGEISNIQVAGGDPREDRIYLDANINDNNVDTGTALMGAESRPGAGDHPFSGGWTITLFGVEGAERYPDGIAGTFGVTNMDETETFVGAYGARMEMQEAP